MTPGGFERSICFGWIYDLLGQTQPWCTSSSQSGQWPDAHIIWITTRFIPLFRKDSIVSFYGRWHSLWTVISYSALPHSKNGSPNTTSLICPRVFSFSLAIFSFCSGNDLKITNLCHPPTILPECPVAKLWLTVEWAKFILFVWRDRLFWHLRFFCWSLCSCFRYSTFLSHAGRGSSPQTEWTRPWWRHLTTRGLFCPLFLIWQWTESVPWPGRGRLQGVNRDARGSRPDGCNQTNHSINRSPSEENFQLFVPFLETLSNWIDSLIKFGVWGR